MWHDIFSLPVDAWEKVLRAVLVYGFLGAVTLFAVNEAVNRAAYRWEWAARLLEGEPSVLIADGKPVPRQLRRASI